MNQIGYYIFVLVAVIVAFIVVKKVASCMIKSVILLAMVGVESAEYEEGLYADQSCHLTGHPEYSGRSCE